MKISVVGAGSFTFGPSFLHQLIAETHLEDYELHLIDPSVADLALMVSVARELARLNDVKVSVSSSVGLDAGLRGTRYVVGAAARGMHSGFETCSSIIKKAAPGHLITEFGGVHGFWYSLHQMALYKEILDACDTECPGAELLIMSNPLPRICTYARNREYEVTGFCSVALVASRMIATAVGLPLEDFPFDEVRSRYEIRCAGTNHLTWLTSVLDRVNGGNVLQSVKDYVLKSNDFGITKRTLSETDCLLANGDDHVRDFLPPYPGDRDLTQIGHGSLTERLAVKEQLARFAAGALEWEEVGAVESWERPADWIEAKELSLDAEFDAVNRVNIGQITGLISDAIVETPAEIRFGSADPVPMTVPLGGLEHNRLAVAITEGLVDAFETHSLGLLDDLLMLDPTVVNQDQCRRALTECLKALPCW